MLADLRRPALLTATLFVFVATFLVRFLSVEFTNDHFVHLTRARQILYGDVPIRDFFDPGMILTHYASALPMALLGPTLLGEAILTSAAIALGTTLVFLLSAQLTGSMVAGAGAGLIAAATMPRLYNYPKVFLFVLAIVCLKRYARRAGVGTLFTLALITVVAFLFRHDHGAYVGVSTALALVVAHWGDWPRLGHVVVRYAVTVVVLLLPWAVFVQWTAGLSSYFASVIPQVRDVTTPRFNWLPFSVDTAAPLVDVQPAPLPRINVRWAPGTSPVQRQDRERQLGLTAGRVDEEPTWSYVLAADDEDSIKRLVRDPLVEDTNGLDRSTYRLTSGESPRQTFNRLLATRVLPGIFTSGNGLAWFYYLTMILPIGALAMLLLLARAQRLPRDEATVVAGLIVLCAVIGQALVRSAPQVRLADIAAPAAALFVWLAWRWRHGVVADVRGWHGPLRAATATVVGLVTLWSAGTIGHAGIALDQSAVLAGVSATRQRWAAAWQELDGPPNPRWVGELYDLAQYVQRCTAPSDRLLVMWFAPELPLYAERPFAGGQECLQIGWNASTADQQLTIERMATQRVPIVLADGPFEDHPSRHKFALIYDYVREHYRVAATPSFGSDTAYSVLIDRRLTPSGTDPQLGLPCYR